MNSHEVGDAELQEFIGGQLKIMCPEGAHANDDVGRGEIASIRFDGRHVDVDLAWYAVKKLGEARGEYRLARDSSFSTSPLTMCMVTRHEDGVLGIIESGTGRTFIFYNKSHLADLIERPPA